MILGLRKKMKFDLCGERGVKGQIFPFLVLIMVVMIVAVMAFVNVAQVNTQKIATMNAVDAAALAGAAQLASTANSIADKNSGPDGLFQNYMWYVANMVYPLDFAPWGVNGRFFGSYIPMSVVNLFLYLSLLASGLAAAQESAAQATTTAFGNMPIEEAQTRVGSVTGQPKVPSGFSQWLQNINFYSEQTMQEYTYSWPSHYYNINENRQMVRQQQDYVKVKVKKPEENSLVLIPMPASPAPSLYIHYLPPCTPVDLCAACAAEALRSTFPAGIALHTWHPWVAAATLGATLTTAAIYNGVGGVPASAPISEILTMLGGFAAALIGLLQPIHILTGCGVPNIVLVIYWMPVPYILSIQNDKAEIGVEVTRFSPTRDLGLWQFKERKITSGARARMRDGSAWSASFRVEATGVWDGEQL